MTGAVTGRRPVIGEIIVEAAAPGRPAAAMVGQTQGKLSSDRGVAWDGGRHGSCQRPREAQSLFCRLRPARPERRRPHPLPAWAIGDGMRARIAGYDGLGGSSPVRTFRYMLSLDCRCLSIWEAR